MTLILNHNNQISPIETLKYTEIIDIDKTTFLFKN